MTTFWLMEDRGRDGYDVWISPLKRMSEPLCSLSSVFLTRAGTRCSRDTENHADMRRTLGNSSATRESGPECPPSGYQLPSHLPPLLRHRLSAVVGCYVRSKLTTIFLFKSVIQAPKCSNTCSIQSDYVHY